MSRRRAAASVAAACWLAIPAGIALVALDPRQGWIGVTVIMGALIVGSSVLALLRRDKRDGDTS